MKNRFLSLLLVSSLFSGCRAEEINASKNEVIQWMVAKASTYLDKNSPEYCKFISLIDEYKKELNSPSIDLGFVQRQKAVFKQSVKRCVDVNKWNFKTYLETFDGEQVIRACFSFPIERVAELCEFKVDSALFFFWRDDVSEFFFYSMNCLKEMGCREVKFKDDVFIKSVIIFEDIFTEEIGEHLAYLRNIIKTHKFFRELGAVDKYGTGEFVYTILNN